MEKLLSFFGLENLFGTVNPAASHAEGIGCILQISHGKAAVIGVGAFLLYQHHDHIRGTVKGIDVRSHHGGIHGRQFFNCLLVLNHNKTGRLHIHAGGGIQTGVPFGILP